MKPTKSRNAQSYRADHTTRSSQVAAHLSTDLREKHGTRSIRVVEGDSVRIVRGEFRGADAKVLRVDGGKGKVVLEGVSREKTRGDKYDILTHPSNLVVTALSTEDGWRRKKIRGLEAEAAPAAGAAAAAAAAGAGAGPWGPDGDDDDDDGAGVLDARLRIHRTRPEGKDDKTERAGGIGEDEDRGNDDDEDDDDDYDDDGGGAEGADDGAGGGADARGDGEDGGPGAAGDGGLGR